MIRKQVSRARHRLLAAMSIVATLGAVAVITSPPAQAATVTTEWLRPATSFNVPFDGLPHDGSNSGQKFATSPAGQNGSFSWTDVMDAAGTAGSNRSGVAGFFRNDGVPAGQDDTGEVRVDAHQVASTTSPNSTVTRSWLDVGDFDATNNGFLFQVWDSSNTLVTSISRVNATRIAGTGSVALTDWSPVFGPGWFAINVTSPAPGHNTGVRIELDAGQLLRRIHLRMTNNTTFVDERLSFEFGRQVSVATPRVGLAKRVSSGPTSRGDGTYSVDYTLVARNYGETTLSSVTITDNLSATFGSRLVSSSTVSNSCAGATLAVGASCTKVIRVIVRPGTSFGPYNNTATVTATPPEGPNVSDSSTNGTNADPDGDGNPTNNSSPTPVSFPPGVSVSGTVLEDTDNNNTGDTPMAGVTVRLYTSTGVLYATTTTNASGAYSFTNVPAGSFTVRETNPSGFTSVSDSDGGPNLDNIAITVAATNITGRNFVDERTLVPPTTFEVSGALTEDVDGDGTGDTPIEGSTVILVNSGGATVATTTTAADGSYSFPDIPAGTYTVVQTNLAGYSSVSDVDGGDPDRITVTIAGADVSGRDFVDTTPNPAIALVKTSDVAAFAATGDSIAYSFAVTNSGNVTLTNITVADPMLAGLDCAAVATLAPGATVPMTCTGNTYTVTQDDVDTGGVTNTATTTGTDPSGEDVTDDDTVDVTGPPASPAIALVKTSDVAAFAAAGDSIAYGFAVTNSGNVTLTDITVSDPLLAGLDCAAVATLAPGATVELSCTGNSYTVTQDDVDTGHVPNTATTTGTDPQGEDVTDNDQLDIVGPAANPAIALVKTADVAAFAATGESIAYSFAVTNSGNVTLTDITVSDPLLAGLDCAAVATLAPGATVTLSCTGNTYTVTQDDVDAGGVSNTATTTGTDPSGEDVTDDDTVDVTGPPADPSIALMKTADVAAFAAPGGAVAYSFAATNSGNVTLTNVTVADPMLVGLDCAAVATLAPGATVTLSCTGNSYTVTQDDVDAGGVSNTATTTGTDPQGEDVTDDDTVDVTGPPANPSIALTKTTDVAAFAAAGESITYGFAVTNSGNVTLTNITVADPMLAGLDCAAVATLAPGATVELDCTGNTYTVTQDDVDAGGVSNTATTTGTDPSGEDVTDEDTVDVTGPPANPSIALMKTTDVAAFAAAGESIAYSFAVTNSGNVTLTDITVSDPLLAGLDCAAVATLAPGASVTLSCTGNTYTVTQDDVDAGHVPNTATTTGTDPSGEDVTDDDTVDVTGPVAGPAIALVKTADVAAFAAAGDPIAYSFAVTNSGNVTLTNITVADPMLAGLDCAAVATLAPGATAPMTCTGNTYTVTQDDVDTGGVTNTATTTGTDPSGGTVTDSDTLGLAGPPANPSIALMKTADVAAFAATGDSIAYGFAVTNSGNVTLTDITVSDPLLAGLDCAAVATLAPGATAPMTCTGNSYTVTQDDVDAGHVPNTATTTGTDPSGEDVTDNDQLDIVGPAANPAIALAKTADVAAFDMPGGAVTYSFAVTNSGNVTLTDITVADPMLAGLDCAAVATLAPGATVPMTCTGNTYTVTQDDVDTGGVTNTATTTGTDPSGEDVTDEDTVDVTGPPANPSIALMKTTDVAAFDTPGDSITYGFAATNSGNVTLTNITVADPMLAGLDCAAVATLAPGATVTLSCTGNTYTVTQDDVDAGHVPNTATTTGTDPSGEDVTDDDTIDVAGPPANPSIALLKTTDVAAFAAAGDSITYGFAVTNSGNVTLTNITVADPMLAGLDCAAVATLAPGATVTLSCTGNTYTVTQDDVDAGGVTNTATTTGTDPSGEDVTDNDTVDVTGPPANPSIALMKTADVAKFVAAGDSITYRFTVTNSGSVTLTDIVLSDPMLTELECAPVATLAPGATVEFDCTGSIYTVTQADADAGVVTNTAGVYGRSPDGLDVLDDDAVAVTAEEPPAPIDEPQQAQSVPPTQPGSGPVPGPSRLARTGAEFARYITAFSLLLLGAGLAMMSLSSRRRMASSE